MVSSHGSVVPLAMFGTQIRMESQMLDCIRSSVMEFRLADFFSEKIIVGPHGVPDPPSLAQMTFTLCTSMSELKFYSGAPPGGQI